jgi:hypothetical protein
MKSLGRFHDQGVTDALKRAENHQGTGNFIRKINGIIFNRAVIVSDNLAGFINIQLVSD